MGARGPFPERRSPWWGWSRPGGGGNGQPSARLRTAAHMAVCTLTPYRVAGPPGNWGGGHLSVRRPALSPASRPWEPIFTIQPAGRGTGTSHGTPRFRLGPDAPTKQCPPRGHWRTPTAGWERGCRLCSSPVYSEAGRTLAEAPACSTVLGWAVWGGRGQVSPLPGAADPEALRRHPPSWLPLHGPLPTSPHQDAPASPRRSSNPTPSRQPSRLLPVRPSPCSGLPAQCLPRPPHSLACAKRLPGVRPALALARDRRQDRGRPRPAAAVGLGKCFPSTVASPESLKTGSTQFYM